MSASTAPEAAGDDAALCARFGRDRSLSSEIAATGSELERTQINGMSREEILSPSMARSITAYWRGWTTAFDPSHEGVKLTTIWLMRRPHRAGRATTKVTPRMIKKLQEQGLKHRLVSLRN